MTKLYLKTTDKALLEAVLEPYLDGEPFGNYFQNNLFCVDWIGLIPAKGQDPEAEEVIYAEGLHFNVLLLDDSIEIFDVFESIWPETPFRVWWDEEVITSE